MEIERDGTCEKEHSFSPTHSNELLFVRPFYHIIWYVGTPSISSTVENLNAKLIVFSFPFYLVAKWMSSLTYVENGEQFSQTLNPPPRTLFFPFYLVDLKSGKEIVRSFLFDFASPFKRLKKIPKLHVYTRRAIEGMLDWQMQNGETKYFTCVFRDRKLIHTVWHIHLY